MNQSDLIKIAYKVINEEGLPVPKKISFRYNTRGVIRKSGICKKQTSHLDNTKEFSITISITKNEFYEDENGKYFDEKLQKRVSKKIVHCSSEEIQKTLAHEIAHLKFWNHDPEHVSYTNYILDKIRGYNEKGN